MRLAERILRGDGLWPASRFPPGLPWLLVPVQAIWGLALMPQKLVVLAAFGVAAVFGARLAVSQWGSVRGGVAAVLGLGLASVLEYSHYVMSEIPYLALSLAALWCADGRGGTSRKGETASALWAGGLAACAFWVRSMGLAVVVAVPLAFLIRGRRGPALIALGASLLLLLPYAVRALGPHEGDSYLRQLLLINPYYPEFGRLTPGEFLTRARFNADEYFLLEIPHIVWPLTLRSTYSDLAALASRLPLPASLAALGLTALGLGVQLARRRAWALVLLFTLMISLSWPPIWTSSRFLIGVAPFFTWSFLSGADLFGRWVLKARAPWFTWTIRGVLGALLLINAVRLGEQAREYPQPWKNYFEAARWVRDATARDAFVIDRKPGLFGFASERRCESFPREADGAQLIGNFRQRGADFVVLPRIPYDDIERFLRPAVGKHREAFEIVYRDDVPAGAETFVFRLRREGKVD
jgi:hypothetical protein